MIPIPLNIRDLSLYHEFDALWDSSLGVLNMFLKWINWKMTSIRSKLEQIFHAKLKKGLELNSNVSCDFYSLFILEYFLSEIDEKW